MAVLGVDWVALGGLAVGAVVGLAGVVASILAARWTGQQRDAERIATERARRRDEAVAALGPVQEFLLDLAPTEISLSTMSDREVQAFLDDLDRRWKAVRGPLIRVRIAHHDGEVRELASKLVTALAAQRRSLREMVNNVMEHAVGDVDTAREDHEHAATLSETLRVALLDKD